MTIKDFSNLYQDDSIVATYKVAEKVTRVFTEDLIKLSELPEELLSNTQSRRIVVFDNACGTAVISDAIHTLMDSKGFSKDNWDLICGDISPHLIGHVQKKVQSLGWSNTTANVVDGQSTGIESTSLTHVYAAFALTAFPDPQKGLRECFRTLQPGGTLAISTWKEPDWLNILRRAVETIPAALPFPTPKEFLSAINAGWDSAEYVHNQLEKTGFVDITTRLISRPFSTTVDDMVEICKPVVPFLVKAFWSPEQREQYEGDILPTLRRYLEETYGSAGVVPQVWTGVFAAGRRPVQFE